MLWTVRKRNGLDMEYFDLQFGIPTGDELAIEKSIKNSQVYLERYYQGHQDILDLLDRF
jgi:hypothetical protein